MTDIPRKPHRPVNMPGPIAIALMTGRPELARAGMEHILATAKGTPHEELATMLVEFAVECVRDIAAERDVMQSLLPSIQDARRNLQGAIGSVERLEDAIGLMVRGDDPESIREALKSNSERTRERKAARAEAEG
ncbi:MAG TPA: hypothetical protein VKD00_06975 [Methyloceanibacter sp.]|nr:hypothetical protein [Methyloceanibacter sp.]